MIITPIKIILMILLLVILRAFTVQHSLVLTKRLAAFFLFFILLVFICFPTISTVIANIIGVGRGVDLIFYLSHLFLLLLIVALWRRSSLQSDKITRLIRELAIQNAKKPN